MSAVPLALGAALLGLGWMLAGQGMTGHMAAHMLAVAVAAPCVALGIAGTRVDPARRLPRIITPLAMSVVELGVVWSWHLPALRTAAAHSALLLALEQASFLAAGVLLWSAVLAPGARAMGVGALLLTSMHMTLLGALIGLAPRPLYPAMAHAAPWGLAPLADQQLAGVVMLLVGGAAYFLGGLGLLATMLRQEARA
ncbi:cytochrome c oxidase assembly protein [Sphingomonas pituitosa]|uniref:cytochrome c oxidase assembly protein n=1 Tax=Sphingomonas pituitosa TaxID=99597 RepID=UPI0008365997|nr:cytochrome c oxidase assembly protein [Sphingomonas pituitosa]